MLNLLSQSRNNSITATRNLLKVLKIQVTETTLENTISTHPDYPSLLSISDALQYWDVSTVAIRTTAEKLYELPLPFIAHIQTRGGQFVVIDKLTGQGIRYFDDQGKNKRYTHEEFYNKWDGVVLLAEDDKHTSNQIIEKRNGEINYKKIRRKEWWKNMRMPIGLSILFILGVVKIIDFLVHGYPEVLYFIALTFFSFIGMLITGLLLWHEYDQNNLLLHKVCSVGKKSNPSYGPTGCQAILGSKASKAIGNITWSEVGFIYFAGSYLYLLIAGATSLSLLMILNILGLSYIVFSIYYQWRVAKQWCILCLTVQSILLLEFLTAILTNQLTIQKLDNLTIQPINHLAIESFILSFFLPAFTWFFSKPYLYAFKKGKQYRYQLARLKNNKDVFHTLLQKQSSLKKNADGLGITIGNPEAKNTLIKVCNPYCGPCAKAHSKIEALIKNNSKWKAQIIFTSTGDENDRRTAPAAHLMAIAAKYDEEKIRRALDDWYNAKEKDYSTFAGKYPMNGEIQLQKEKLQAMNKWCKEEKITATPTFFVKYISSNGEKASKLAWQYGVEDLMHL